MTVDEMQEAIDGIDRDEYPTVRVDRAEIARSFLRDLISENEEIANITVADAILLIGAAS